MKRRPTASLKTLLRLTAIEPVVWLSAPEKAADLPVQWVAKEIAAGRPGDVVLLPAASASESLLAESEAYGVLGLVFLGPVKNKKIFKNARLPVAVLPEQLDHESVHRLLLTVLVAQQAHLREIGSDINTQLDRLVAEGEGLPGLARAMAEISGRGVVIQDKRLKVLAASSSQALDAVWVELTGELESADKLPEALRDRKEAGKSPIFLYQDLPGGLTRLITPINVGAVARGYLSLVGLQGDLDDLDEVVADQGALVCAVQMSRSKAVRETEKRLRRDLLNALLQEDLSARDARLWAQTIGLDLAQAHVPLRFAWDMAAPPSLRRLETLVNGVVSRLGVTVIISPLSSEVICFCQVSPEISPPQRALEFGQIVIERAREENPQNRICCGIGTPALDLNDWGASFRQAGQALVMARRLAEDKPLYFPDLTVYRLLLQIEHTPELHDFQEEILGPLLAYETGEELVRTLQAYFDHNGNLSQTADALFIHRNSLLYRMERIAEISGLDLDNPEIRLAVQLALHVHKMLKTVNK